jgi:hypothetical protein
MAGPQYLVDSVEQNDHAPASTEPADTRDAASLSQ